MRLFLSLLFYSFLLSCTSPSGKASLLGSWRLQDIIAEGAEDDFEKSAQLKNRVKEGLLVSFFDDGTYTQVKGNGEYITGKWTEEEDGAIRLKSANGKITDFTISIQELPKGRQQLTLGQPGNATTLQLLQEAKPLANATQDPFHPVNNQWRIKAQHQETDQEISKRMANYIKHFATILKAATTRKQEVVYFDFSLGPVKVYNSGIGIHSYSLMPASWKAPFYNEADALTAYQVYSKILSASSYRGANSGNWMEDDYNILQSLYMDMINGMP